MILQQLIATKHHKLYTSFLHITYFLHISHVESFFHMTICHVEHFSTWQSVMWRNFSTWQKNSPQAPPVMPVTNIRYGLCIAPKLKVSNGWVLRTPNRIWVNYQITVGKIASPIWWTMSTQSTWLGGWGQLNQSIGSWTLSSAPLSAKQTNL